jgi:hypothetical protein
MPHATIVCTTRCWVCVFYHTFLWYMRERVREGIVCNVWRKIGYIQMTIGKWVDSKYAFSIMAQRSRDNYTTDFGHVHYCLSISISRQIFYVSSYNMHSSAFCLVCFSIELGCLRITHIHVFCIVLRQDNNLQAKTFIVSGTIVLPLWSCMNHSYHPNAKVFKTDEVCTTKLSCF